jgi:hypothetical protein
VSRSITARLNAVEKVIGGRNVRRGYSLEQFIRAANGFEVGPPASVLQPGELSVEELILETRRTPVP